MKKKAVIGLVALSLTLGGFIFFLGIEYGKSCEIVEERNHHEDSQSEEITQIYLEIENLNKKIESSGNTNNTVLEDSISGGGIVGRNPELSGTPHYLSQGQGDSCESWGKAICEDDFPKGSKLICPLGYNKTFMSNDFDINDLGSVTILCLREDIAIINDSLND